MGIVRFMSTIQRHPAMVGAFTEIIPNIECLLIDYNANIHYVLQKTITELNEILYYTFYNCCIDDIFIVQNTEYTEYKLNLSITVDELENKLIKYNNDYAIGNTYEEIFKSLSDHNKITEIIFMETIKYTKEIINVINTGSLKKVFMALDGTPSMAKIKEQKNRRYIGSYLNNIKMNIAKKYKFNDDNIYQIDIFYFRLAICVGTNFMNKIQQALFNLDEELEIEVSTLNIKGEGEKKIIHAMEEITEYSSYCIMSPDSDMLILIALLMHNKDFKGKNVYNFRINYQNNHSYQFFDLPLLLNNFVDYYSNKLQQQITNDKMIEVFFMMVVFGNDFLPKLEPLEITKHFDLVCETCLKISVSGIKFIHNNDLNYNFILQFFREINKDVITMSVEQTLENQYNNFKKQCHLLSLSHEYLDSIYHHPSIVPINVDYTNIVQNIKIINTSYFKLFSFLKNTVVASENIIHLYNELHSTPGDSYMILVLPRLLKFPGSDHTLDPKTFFFQFINYTNNTSDFGKIKFRSRLMNRDYEIRSGNDRSTLTSFMIEMERFDKSLEPYRSLLKMKSINLVEYNIFNGNFKDLRREYYKTYVDQNISEKEIYKLVEDYIVGIEWLYQYYITGKRMEWSGWNYNHTQPPLMDDIINYLENQTNINNILQAKLNMYPENEMGPLEHYLFVTPNEYTQANIAPNLSDVIHLIDGNGAMYLNKAQIKWHCIGKN